MKYQIRYVKHIVKPCKTCESLIIPMQIPSESQETGTNWLKKRCSALARNYDGSWTSVAHFRIRFTGGDQREFL